MAKPSGSVTSWVRPLWDTADAVQDALANLGELACTIFSEGDKLAGKTCAVAVNFSADYARGVIADAYRDHTCLVVGSSGAVSASYALFASNDSALCR
jgi:hypothetical protein